MDQPEEENKEKNTDTSPKELSPEKKNKVPKKTKKHKDYGDEKDGEHLAEDDVKSENLSAETLPKDGRKDGQLSADEDKLKRDKSSKGYLSSSSLRTSSGEIKREKRKSKKKPIDYASEGEEGRLRAKTQSHLAKLKIIVEHKRNEIGEIIYKGHPSWVLMQNIQTGIRQSVGKSSEIVDENSLKQLKHIERSEAFFKSPGILRFPPEGSSETAAHKTGLFKFKDYCPLVFRHLRQKFGIDPGDYMVSLCNALEDGKNALRELPTPGKSGSLFFFSHDMRYILKTIPKREAKLLRYLLPAYYKHVMENSNTLLPKFFGLHRVKPHKGRQVRFVVMGNVFNTNKKIHERFDLKGSTFGRVVTDEEKLTFKENVTYKDIDWRAGAKKLRLGRLKDLFCEQLKSDCKFLEKLNIMDYSLLVGVHQCEKNDGADCSLACLTSNIPPPKEKKQKKEKKEKRSKKEKKEKQDKKTESKVEEKKIGGTKPQPDTDDSSCEIETNNAPGKKEESDSSDLRPGHNRTKSTSMQQTSFPLPAKFQKQVISAFQAEDGGMRAYGENEEKLSEYYFVGIIDILMLYTLRKKAEHTYKTIRFNSEKSEISSVNPTDYAKRFLEFIVDQTV